MIARKAGSADGPGVDYVDRVEVVGQPILVVSNQQRLVGGDLGRSRQAGAACVERVLGQRLHAVQDQQVVEVHLRAVGDASQLLDVWSIHGLRPKDASRS